MKISVFYDHITQAKGQTNRSLDDLLGEIKKDGIDGVEINYSQIVRDKSNILSALGKAGLQISCIYESYDWGNDNNMEQARKQICLAKETGASKILVIPGFLPEKEAALLNNCSKSYEETVSFMEKNESVQNMKQALTELTDYASQTGVFVTLEDFDKETAPFSRMCQLKWFMENVPGLRYTFDTGNFAYSDENVVAAYDLLSDKIVHVHCKDRGIQGEPKGEFHRGMKVCAVGQGYIPIKELVRKIEAKGYDGFFAIEHFDAPDQMAYIKESAAYLRQERESGKV